MGAGGWDGGCLGEARELDKGGRNSGTRLLPKINSWLWKKRRKYGVVLRKCVYRGVRNSTNPCKPPAPPLVSEYMLHAGNMQYFEL